MKRKIEKFRNGMFFAPSRTYGESYMEPIIRKILGLSESPTGENDALNDNGEFGEIKCSKVLWTKPKTNSLLERIISENENNVLTRLIPFAGCYDSKYDANIQNIKRDHFEFLIYVMLFEDCIQIFKSYRGDISSKPGWSGRHGRFDVVGKSGQFSIRKNNIEKHLKNNLIDTKTWEEVYEITKDIS
tara:strand:+ start:175 stop:735 length:561 start_codon:yes stop_codon:yes gene_type:complete